MAFRSLQDGMSFHFHGIVTFAVNQEHSENSQLGEVSATPGDSHISHESRTVRQQESMVLPVPVNGYEEGWSV